MGSLFAVGSSNCDQTATRLVATSSSTATTCDHFAGFGCIPAGTRHRSGASQKSTGGTGRVRPRRESGNLRVGQIGSTARHRRRARRLSLGAATVLGSRRLWPLASTTSWQPNRSVPRKSGREPRTGMPCTRSTWSKWASPGSAEQAISGELRGDPTEEVVHGVLLGTIEGLERAAAFDEPLWRWLPEAGEQHASPPQRLVRRVDPVAPDLRPAGLAERNRMPDKFWAGGALRAVNEAGRGDRDRQHATLPGPAGCTPRTPVSQQQPSW
jgi:hypothetical protein